MKTVHLFDPFLHVIHLHPCIDCCASTAKRVFLMEKFHKEIIKIINLIIKKPYVPGLYVYISGLCVKPKTGSNIFNNTSRNT